MSANAPSSAAAAATATPVATVPSWNRAALALLALALAWCYRDVFALLLAQWSADNAYSHGYAVAPIGAWLAYRRTRGLVARTTLVTAVLGALVLLGGLALLMLGRAAHMASAQEVSLLVGLAGMAVLFAGLPGLQANWLAIA